MNNPSKLKIFHLCCFCFPTACFFLSLVVSRLFFISRLSPEWNSNIIFFVLHYWSSRFKLLCHWLCMSVLIWVWLPYIQVRQMYSMISRYKLKPNGETFRSMITLCVKMKDVSFYLVPPWVSDFAHLHYLFISFSVVFCQIFIFWQSHNMEVDPQLSAIPQFDLIMFLFYCSMEVRMTCWVIWRKWI